MKGKLANCLQEPLRSKQKTLGAVHSVKLYLCFKLYQCPHFSSAQCRFFSSVSCSIATHTASPLRVSDLCEMRGDILPSTFYGPSSTSHHSTTLQCVNCIQLQPPGPSLAVGCSFKAPTKAAAKKEKSSPATKSWRPGRLEGDVDWWESQ